MLKKILNIFIVFMLSTNICFAGFEYKGVNIDDTDPSVTYIGKQMRGGISWEGQRITVSTETGTVIEYVAGVSTSTYYDWQVNRKSTSTIYFNAFEYNKYKNLYK